MAREFKPRFGQGLVWNTPTQMMRWADFILRGNEDALADVLRAELRSEQVDTPHLGGNMHHGFGVSVERGNRTAEPSSFLRRIPLRAPPLCAAPSSALDRLGLVPFR